MGLNSEEIRRYRRHLKLPQVGLIGQERLKAAKVLVVGAGGLGSPVALYLAAAGVGRLGLVDFDEVELSNLQRQVLHTTESVGRSKVQSAQERISALNPHVQTELHPYRLNVENAVAAIDPYDLVVDGSDNFSTRYLINDACYFLKRPLVYASIFQFEAQLSVFRASGPCYRCLYPEPPPSRSLPNCADAGVLGVLPGIVGTLQATEALKFFLGEGNLLVGRLLLFDALQMKFKEVKLRKDPECRLCGKNPEIFKLAEMENRGRENSMDSDLEISATELKQAKDRGDDFLLLDVREPEEVEIASIGGTLIPLAQLPSRLQELPKDKEIVVLCHGGMRSLQATKFLKQQGFDKVRSLAGGIEAWSTQVDHTVPRY